ncbi:MAG: LytR/AlgR family response regulator transcription factor [Hyphomicrobiales bacterium]
MDSPFIVINISKNRYRKIYLSDILYCKAERAYSIIKTVTKEFLLSHPLKNLEYLLNYNGFVRVNRSYIVNIEKCIELKTGNNPQIIMNNDEVIKPSRDNVSELKSLFLLEQIA